VPGAMDGRPLLSVLMHVYTEARTLRHVVDAVQAVPLDKEIIEPESPGGRLERGDQKEGRRPFETRSWVWVGNDREVVPDARPSREF